MNRSRNTCAAAVFVKTPGLSPIKTRLAASVGRELAEDWHRRAADCVANVVLAADLPCYWAVAEPDALDQALWSGLPRLAQGSGSLGQRMARIHSALLQQHSAAVLLGADLPQLEARHLRAATEWLNKPGPRAVLGPARDGGFWLFGANRPAPEAHWTAVTYSRDDTARNFRAALGEEFVWSELEPLTDLDTADDLVPVHAELDRIAEPLACQIMIRDWLASLAGIGQ
jgi:rSAM/selenodomain-associated transferase 1